MPADWMADNQNTVSPVLGHGEHVRKGQGTQAQSREIQGGEESVFASEG